MISIRIIYYRNTLKNTTNSIFFNFKFYYTINTKKWKKCNEFYKNKSWLQIEEQ